MSRDVNRQKRLQWAQTCNNEMFDDVIFSDEASFEVQRCATRTFYKKGQRYPRGGSKGGGIRGFNPPSKDCPVESEIWRKGVAGRL